MSFEYTDDGFVVNFNFSNLCDGPRLNKKFPEQMNDTLRSIYFEQGFILYRDVWNAFNMKHGDFHEGMKLVYGNWDKYSEFIIEKINELEEKKKSVLANIKGLRGQMSALPVKSYLEIELKSMVYDFRRLYDIISNTGDDFTISNACQLLDYRINQIANIQKVLLNIDKRNNHLEKIINREIDKKEKLSRTIAELKDLID